MQPASDKVGCSRTAGRQVLRWRSAELRRCGLSGAADEKRSAAGFARDDRELRRISCTDGADRPAMRAADRPRLHTGDTWQS